MDRKTKLPSDITGSVRELIREYVASDPGFRDALKREAIAALSTGEFATGRAILRDYIDKR
jgi:hypothetical protein